MRKYYLKNREKLAIKCTSENIEEIKDFVRINFDIPEKSFIVNKTSEDTLKITIKSDTYNVKLGNIITKEGNFLKIWNKEDFSELYYTQKDYDSMELSKKIANLSTYLGLLTIVLYIKLAGNSNTNFSKMTLVILGVCTTLHAIKYFVKKTSEENI